MSEDEEIRPVASVELTIREAILVAKQMVYITDLPFGGGGMSISREDIQDAMNVIDKFKKSHCIKFKHVELKKEIKDTSKEKAGFFRSLFAGKGKK